LSFLSFYGYDRYDNCTITLSTGLAYDEARELNSSYNSLNNRLIGNQSGAVNYDAAGNQTNYSAFGLSYDAENKIKAFTNSGDSGTYYYDGDGRRVKKVLAPNGGTSTTTCDVYDALGRLALEYSNEASSSSGVTSWMFTDMLGSVQTITSEAGSSGYGSVRECHDYLPFGRILSSSDNSRGSCHQ
jgi:YD repeat-containing protein